MRYQYRTDAITGTMIHALPAGQRQRFFPESNIIPLQRDTYLFGGDVQLVTGPNIVARTRGMFPGPIRVADGSIPVGEHLRGPIWNPFLWKGRRG